MSEPRAIIERVDLDGNPIDPDTVDLEKHLDPWDLNALIRDVLRACERAAEDKAYMEKFRARYREEHGKEFEWPTIKREEAR